MKLLCVITGEIFKPDYGGVGIDGDINLVNEIREEYIDSFGGDLDDIDLKEIKESFPEDLGDLDYLGVSAEWDWCYHQVNERKLSRLNVLEPLLNEMLESYDEGKFDDRWFDSACDVVEKYRELKI